jgi:hypothetical protein
MNTKNLWIPLIAMFCAACASSPKTKANAAPANPSDPVVAMAQEKAKEAKDRPPVKVGPDVIVQQGVEAIWPLLSKVDDWGTWMSKVTKVDAGAGLSAGAVLKWQWEEKPIESTIVEVTENQTFAFKACASSKKATVRWTLKSMSPTSTLISLRAEVPYGTASETMDKLGPEMNEWITALQTAANKIQPKKDEEKE